MPQVQINNGDIDIFFFKASFDLYLKTALFTTAASTYSNVNNVAGISFQVVDKLGTVYKDFDFTTPDIIPSSASTYTLDWSSFGLPFILGNTLKITGGIKDINGNIYYTDPVYKTICKPVGLTESGYVPGIFQVIPDCINNVLTVKELTVFVLNSTVPVSVSKTGNLFYPTGTIAAVPFTNTPFSNNVIYTGQNRVECSSVATYDLGDDIFILVTYLTKSQFNVVCNNFLGDISCCLTELQQRYLLNCDNAQGAFAKQQSWDIMLPLMNGFLKQITGQDASAEAAIIKKTLGCDCGVNSLGQNEMTPVNPAVSSIVLVGAGGTTIPDPVISGNTKTYTVLSKNYLVSKADNTDLSYSITSDTSVTNLVNFKLKFNPNIEAGYILTAIGNDPNLISILNSLIVSSGGGVNLSGLNGKCIIDLTDINYLFTQNINAATLVTAISTATQDYAAPANLFATDSVGVAAWLNGLGIGTFIVTGSSTVIGVLSNNNTFNLSSFTFSNPDLTVFFQKTDKTLVQVLQAIIDYICGLTALQVALGSNLVLYTIDYSGNVVEHDYLSTDSQDDFNKGIQSSIKSIIDRITEFTGITCAQLKAIFIDRPLAVFGSNDRIYGTLGGDCAGLTDEQIALAVFGAAGKYDSVKSAFCSIDCSSPSKCPEISNINLAMVGANIGVYGVTFGSTTLGSQTVTVRYKTSSTDVWLVATNALLLFPNGNINGTSPFLITGLVAGTQYDVQVVNNCGGVGFVKQITTPTGTAYTGQFQLDNVIYNICGETPVTRYTAAPFAVGQIVYTNIGLSVPQTGYHYIADVTGEIYTISNTTGQVLSDTGTNCNNGTSNQVLLGNNSGTICGATVTTGYTNGIFVVGGTLYSDAALTLPVTGFSYVVNTANNKIYGLNSSTGAILAAIGTSCTAYSGTFYPSNTALGTCGAGGVTLYSAAVFAPGVTMYTDSGLTTLATGHNYILAPDNKIYNIGNATGQVGLVTGTVCP